MKLKRNEIAAIKRVAMTVQPLLKKKDKKLQEIVNLKIEIDALEAEIAVWDQGIKNLTGYSVEQLVEKEVVNGNTKFKIREDILEEEEPATTGTTVTEENVETTLSNTGTTNEIF